MVTLVGRLTADAKVNTLDNDKKVVHFSIALNDEYKGKNDTEWKQLTTYVEASYWRSTSIAKSLRKGAMVQLIGRLGSKKPWQTREGEWRSGILFHTSMIQIMAWPPRAEGDNSPVFEGQDGIVEPSDDLPF